MLFLIILMNAETKKRPCLPFPESALDSCIDNTWGDTGKAIFNNWLGLVYGLTSHDRLKQYMDGVDPKNPLDIKI